MVWRWSKTAATNAAADSSINWAEGMAPSAVNDSARAEMARVAQWRDDISGAILTTGTGTAYAVSSNQVFDSLANLNGAMVAFTPHATNTGTITLNVDSLGAKPLRAAPSADLPSGSLILGTPYVATYNNTDAVWYLQGGLSNPYNVPIGGMIGWTGSTAPNSAFAMPYGQSLSRTTYASLWTFAQAEIALGNTLYTNGDGSTTFTILDLRGRVTACPDNMGGVSAGRLSAAMTSTTIGATGGAPNYQLNTGNLPAYTPSGSVSVAAPSQTDPRAYIGPFQGGGTGLAYLFGATGASGDAAVNSTAVGSNGAPGASFTGTAQGGTSAAFNLVQPTIIIPKILRII